MRPMFPYYGSKWALARHYPAPEHELVVEPFAGAAGYAIYHGARRALLIDADPIIVGVWDFLLRASAGEILALPDMPEVGDSVDNYAIPQEAKWLIGFWLNRGSAQPKKSRTAYSARTDRAQLNWGPRAKARIAAQLPFVAGWSVQQGTYADAPNIEATWCIDPPYELMGHHYRVPFNEYPALARWCRSRTGLVLVCEGHGASWLPFRPLGDFKTTRGKAPEVLLVERRAA